MKHLFYISSFIILILGSSCEDFFQPEQSLNLLQSELPNDESELRSMSLGLYAIQQDLVEQIVILGELRGDLLKTTENADPDLIEVNSLQLSPSNEFASAENFYRLISACNKMIYIIEKKYPEVLDKNSTISNIHAMYGEAICMRSWAYFNAARIYDEIPYIPSSLTTLEEVYAYVNSPGKYVDSVYIDYSVSGLENDTILDQETIYDSIYVYDNVKYLSQQAMVLQCMNDIENNVRAVGVDYSYDNDDITWRTTVWNTYAMHTLMGQMALHIGDYDKALEHFNYILDYQTTDEDEQFRFGLTELYGLQENEDLELRSEWESNWNSIFKGVNSEEHIFTLWFGKSNSSWQKNNLQKYFSVRSPNNYSIKPTKKAVELWETVWLDATYELESSDPSQSSTLIAGYPGDFARGYNTSYRYYKNGVAMTSKQVKQLLELKRTGSWDEVEDMMKGVDTVAFKYIYAATSGNLLVEDPFAQSSNFIVYRAAAVHLWAAEIYLWMQSQGSVLNKVDKYLFTGDYISILDDRLGVAGRVYGYDNTSRSETELKNKPINDIQNSVSYTINPYTNMIEGYTELSTDKRRRYYQDVVLLNEKSREMAFEGERYYDLIRIATRYNKMGIDGGEWLGNILAPKFPASEREQIKAYVKNPSNWYIPFVLKQ